MAHQQGNVVAPLGADAADIARLGAARTSIFGNLIPIFASLEAVLILGEKISWIHYLSMILVITGLVIANIRRKNGS